MVNVMMNASASGYGLGSMYGFGDEVWFWVSNLGQGFGKKNGVPCVLHLCLGSRTVTGYPIRLFNSWGHVKNHFGNLWTGSRVHGTNHTRDIIYCGDIDKRRLWEQGSGSHTQSCSGCMNGGGGG